MVAGSKRKAPPPKLVFPKKSTYFTHVDYQKARALNSRSNLRVFLSQEAAGPVQAKRMVLFRDLKDRGVIVLSEGRITDPANRNLIHVHAVSKLDDRVVPLAGFVLCSWEELRGHIEETEKQALSFETLKLPHPPTGYPVEPVMLQFLHTLRPDLCHTYEAIGARWAEDEPAIHSTKRARRNVGVRELQGLGITRADPNLLVENPFLAAKRQWEQWALLSNHGSYESENVVMETVNRSILGSTHPSSSSTSSDTSTVRAHRKSVTAGKRREAGPAEACKAGSSENRDGGICRYCRKRLDGGEGTSGAEAEAQEEQTGVEEAAVNDDGTKGTDEEVADEDDDDWETVDGDDE